MKAVFKKGDVIKIFYFVTITKHRRMLTFTGLCTNYNKLGGTFTLKNFCNSEYVTFSFFLSAPNIVAIDVLTSYNFNFKQAKLHGVKRFNLIGKTDIAVRKVAGPKKDPLPYFYIPSTIFPKEKKRLRNKFRL